MGSAINRFNGGLDQDTNIQDYSNQKYYDALNMQIISKGNLQIGSFENEKGMSASLSLPSNVRIYTFDVTTSGNWIGTIAVSGEAGSPFSVNCSTTDSWVTGISATPQAVPDGENSPPASPKYSVVKTETWWAIQNNNRISIVTLNDQTVTVTKTGGSGVLTPTSTPYITSGTDQRIIGYTPLRTRTIVFTTSNLNNTTTPTNTLGFIWSINFNTNGSVASTTLLYGGVLKFSRANPIDAKSFYINERYGKIYFVDNYNNLRHFNAYDPTLLSKLPNQLDLLSDVIFDKPRIVNVLLGGNYKSGSVQYAYQLYNKYGTETIMSPVSNLIPISSGVDNMGSSDYFLGSPVDEPTGKAVEVEIPYLDTRFEYVKVYSVYYNSDVATPEIRLIADQRIVFKTNSFKLIDDGFTSLGSLTLQEFRNYYKNIFGAKSIELQNNRLIAANLKENYFDVDYDARAYRWNTGGTLIKIDGATRGTMPNNTTEKYLDAVYDPTTANYDVYKFKSAGGTIGGTGPNISYEFATAELQLDSLNKSLFTYAAAKGSQQWSSITGGNLINNSSFTSYASPINSSQMVGYKRGETYRFGILFRDSKGRISPVKWIGDIKMPEAYDTVGSTFVPGTGATPQYYDNSGDKIGLAVITDYPTHLLDRFGDKPEPYYISFLGSTSSYFIKITVGTVSYTSPVVLSTTAEYPAKDFIKTIEDLVKNQMSHIYDFNYTIDSVGLTLVLKFTSKNNVAITSTITIYENYSDAGFTFVSAGGAAETPGASIQRNDHVINKKDGATTNYNTTAQALYPIFTVTGIPNDEWGNPCSYQIVRAERTERDKTCLSQGLLTATTINGNEGNTVYLPDLIGEYTLNGKTLLNYIAPEVNFRKLSVRDTDTLYVIGSCIGDNGYGSPTLKVHSVVPLAAHIPIDIVDSGILKADTDIQSPKLQRVKDYKIYNVVLNETAKDKKRLALGGTSMFIATGAVSGLTSYRPMAEIRRTLSDQYGGNTYYDRINTEYIDTGHFKKSGDSSVNPVFGGDTYIAFFDYLRAMWVDKQYNETNDEIGQYHSHIYLPVETSINLDYRYDRSYTKSLNYFSATSDFIQEYAGDYSGKVGGDNEDKIINYVQEYDLYLENPVYSKQNNINKYLAQPLEQDGEETDCMIRVSEEFNYNSVTDDLIKFLPLNFKIVSTQYGQITHLTTFKENVLFFQEKAIGVQPIAERTVIQDNQGIGLVLGTGDLFGNYQYISKTSGCRNKSSITTTDYGIYYFDAQSKTFNRLQQGLSEVSTIKGLSSYFESNVPNGVLSSNNSLGGYGVHTGYDKKNKRVFFSLLYDATLWTVSFNELTESFESFHSFVPRMYLTDSHGNLHSENPAALGAFYCHNKGNYGHFYGTYYDSTVTYLVTEHPTINKKFANLEIDYRLGIDDLASSTDTNRLTNTLTKIKFWDDYQTTDDLAVVNYPSPATPASQIQGRQKFGLWRFIIPTVAESTRPTRFFDKHLFTKLTYTNTSADKRLVINNAITHYQDASL